MSGVASPCVGVCEIDPDTGFCRGCARTAEEIGWWRGGSAAARAAVWAELPARFDALGVVARRLPWGRAETLDFIEQSIRDAAGTWVLGVVGAVGEFMCGAKEPVEIRRDDRSVVAITPRAALRLSVDDQIRAVEVETDGRSNPIVLATKSETDPLPVVETLTALGPDADALHLPRQRDQLFDLGLGRDVARFCIRTGDEELIALLTDAETTTWPSWLGALGPEIVKRSPTRVVETRLGRVEIDGPIPRPGGASPDGPHTHLLPDHLALGLDAPAELRVPVRYAPGAVFYPR